jgi:inosine-uridine nucleoside N-ribohydrolase
VKTEDASMPQRVIIDTDPGIDDALALILALVSPEIRLEAITTVCGNVPVDFATANALRVLGLFPLEQRPPMAQGAERPLVRPLSTAAVVHGDDGLGGVTRQRLPDGRPRYQPAEGVLSTTDAITCLLDFIQRYPGELTLIALGPLTNLAQAWQRDPTIMRQLAGVVIMGGAITVPGNVSPVAEFNISVDPEAAQLVFTSGLPLTLIGLDVTERVRLTTAMLEQQVQPLGTRLSQFVLDCTAHAIQFSDQVARPNGMAMHDPLAVGAVVDPALIRTVALPVQVETTGELTTAMTVADRRPLSPNLKAPANMNVALGVDGERFLELFLSRLRRL